MAELVHGEGDHERNKEGEQSNESPERARLHLLKGREEHLVSDSPERG